MHIMYLFSLLSNFFLHTKLLSVVMFYVINLQMWIQMKTTITRYIISFSRERVDGCLYILYLIRDDLSELGSMVLRIPKDAFVIASVAPIAGRRIAMGTALTTDFT